MRSRRDDVDHRAAVERALVHGLCGLGGILERAPASLTEAVSALAAQHDERVARRVERFAAVPAGAFVWTRDGEGLFWLGRVDGAWRYDASRDAAAVDLVHVRPCEWGDAPISDQSVPPGVRLAFARGGRNWQEIREPAAAAATDGLWGP